MTWLAEDAKTHILRDLDSLTAVLAYVGFLEGPK